MSLFIVGSVSRVTSKIVEHLAKNSQYKSVTIADLLPVYEYHNRFYKLQKSLEDAQSNLQVKLTRPNALNDLKAEGFDDVLFVTHDYYQNVTSKTKLMQTAATAWKNRSHLFFATPVEYDRFGYANPEGNYTQAESRVFEINPNSTVIRSDILEGTETWAALNPTQQSSFSKVVKLQDYAKVVCDTLTARLQGKKLLVRGKERSSATSVEKMEELQYKHSLENTSELVTKYGSYKFNGYDLA